MQEKLTITDSKLVGKENTLPIKTELSLELGIWLGLGSGLGLGLALVFG